MKLPVFSILITTKNRLHDLKITLSKINYLINNENLECIICDDGSNDGTYDFLKENYPKIQLLRNVKSLGLIASRNRLLNLTIAKYAISLDDDAHIITPDPLPIISGYFENNSKCGVIALRIFWGKILSENYATNEKSLRVKGFVGCGHVWNMDAWRDIPKYPEWFIFYGEEDFAAYQLFRKKWQVHYVPDVLVQHRVEVKDRKKEADYAIRLRRSLRAGWYNYFLFFPWSLIPRRFFYTLFVQFRLKLFKGDLKSTLAIFQALLDLILHLPKLMKNRNSLSISEFKELENLSETKIYWKEGN